MEEADIDLIMCEVLGKLQFLIRAYSKIKKYGNSRHLGIAREHVQRVFDKVVE